MINNSSRLVYSIFAILALSLLLSMIPLQTAFAASVSFDPEINVSSNISNSQTPEIAISGLDAYIIWRDANDIFFINSTNNGLTFPFPAEDIGDTGGSDPDLGHPHIATEGDNVYAVWANSGGIHFNYSNDNGKNFASAIVEVNSGTSTTSNKSPQLEVSSNNDVHVIWVDRVAATDSRILYANSTDNGVSFGTIMQLDNDSDALFPDPQIMSSGSNVYAIWQDGTNINFAKSSNPTDSFNHFVTVGTTSNAFIRAQPQIAVNGENVYAVWQDISDIRFAKSSNYGVDFVSPADPSNGVLGTTGLPAPNVPIQIETSGSNVFVFWQDNDDGNGDIKLRRSLDNGSNFEIEKNISSNTGISTNPKSAVSGSDLHLIWKDTTLDPDGDILHVISTDNGLNFGSSQQVSNDPESSDEGSLTASGSTPYVVWKDGDVGDIMFRTGSLSNVIVEFDKDQYKLGDNATLTITDEKLEGNGSLDATITSDTNPTGIEITLTERSGDLGTFDGEFWFTEDGTPTSPILKTSPGETISTSHDGTVDTASIFPRIVDLGFDDATFNFIINPLVEDNNANTDPLSYQQVEITITAPGNPTGIQLILNETGVDSDTFGGALALPKPELILMAGDITPTISNTLTASSLDISGNDDPLVKNKINFTVTTDSEPLGVVIEAEETDVNSSCFEVTFGFSTVASDPSLGKVLAAEGDFFTVIEPSGEFAARGIIEPNPYPIDRKIKGAINALDLSGGSAGIGICDGGPDRIAEGEIVTATHLSATDSLSVDDGTAGGGGGGGLVRPSLVVNALGGLGGGSTLSAPQLQISNLVTNSLIDIPLEVEQMIYDHDSVVPMSPMDLGYFESFDYPLVINDKGFILSGFTTTLETQTLKTNTPHTIKFLFYESNIIQHFSLYTNLRDANDQISDSDTQILYNANQETQVVDPNGFFESVSLTVNELEDNKKEVILEITFANTMDTSHIIVRSWDPNLYSADTHILDAWEIVSDIDEEFPTPTYPEPEIENLQSQTIPIWIKNNAAWWSEQQIGDSDFVSGIEYLIKNKIINVPGVEVGTDSATTEIPDWIKNNAGWWAESLITDEDFIEGIQWLVANGVIQI